MYVNNIHYHHYVGQYQQAGVGLLLPGCCSAVIGGLFLYVHGGDCLYNVDGGWGEGVGDKKIYNDISISTLLVPRKNGVFFI